MFVKHTRIGILRKGLSVLLAVVLTLGYAGLFVGLFAIRADATELTNVVIGVPETVYMTPANNYNTATTTVKYYVNNTVSSSGGYSLDAVNNSTTGKFYVYSPQISSIDSVSVNGATLSGLSATKNGSLFSDTSFTMTLASGITSSQAQLLEWTIKVTDTGGMKHALHAYTVAYDPYLSPIFTAIRHKADENDDLYCSGLSWVSGIHGIHDKGDYYPKDNFLPLLGGPTTEDGTTNPDNWFASDKSQQCGLPTAGGWYQNKTLTQDVTWVFERSAVGHVYVDSSRYSNLNKIPYLTTGLYVTDCESEDTGCSFEMKAYVADITGSSNPITSGTSGKSGNDYSPPGEWNASWTKLLAGSRDNNYSTSYPSNPYYNVTIDRAVPSSNQDVYIRAAVCYTQKGGGGWFDSDENDMAVTIMDSYLQVRPVNKASLRNLIKECYKYTSTYYPSTQYDTFITAWRNAATVLGDPTRSDTTDVYNALNSAKNALVKVTELTLNTQENITFTASNRERWLSFTPSDSGFYIFFDWYTSNYPDAKINIYPLDLDVMNGVGTKRAYIDDYNHNSTSTTSSYGNQNQTFDGTRVAALIGATSDYSSSSGRWQVYCDVNLDANQTYFAEFYTGTTTSSYFPATLPFKVCKAVNITFNASGGATTFTIPLPAGHTMKMNQTGLTRDGHTLIGWCKTAYDYQRREPMEYAATETITIPDSDATYVALWNPSNPTEVSVNTTTTGTVDAGYQIIYYKFVPSETRKYIYYSLATTGDPYGVMYKASDWANSGTILTYDDDSGKKTNLYAGEYSYNQFTGSTSIGNFFMKQELTANTTYLLGVKYYNTGTGSYPFRIEPIYKVEYNANDGTGAPGEQEKCVDRDLTLSSTVPTRTGYTFLGWSTDQNATTATYAAGGTYTANADAKLYAVWKINTSKLTVDPNGGTWNGSTANQSFTQNYNTTKTIGAPTRTGYTFTGWSLSSGANGSFSNGVYTFGPTQGANDTLTAAWGVNKYVFDVNGWIEDYVDPEDPIGNLAGSLEGAGSFDVYLNGTLMGDGTGVEDYAKQIDYGTSYEIRNITAAPGWHYEGPYEGNFSIGTWYSGASTTALQGTLDENGVFIVLQFDKNRSGLTVVPNGGTWEGYTTAQTYQGKYGATRTIADPTPPTAQHAFTGWTLSSNANGSFADGVYTYGPTQNATDTLTADYVQVVQDDVYVLDSAVLLDVLGNDLNGTGTQTGSGLTLTGITTPSSASVTASVTNNHVALVPDGFLTGAVTFTYTAQYDGEDYTANVKVIPASSIYYEESIFNFGSGWIDAANANAVFDAVLSEETYHGVSTSYNKYNSSTYSMGTAKYAVVSSTNKMGPTVTFSFAGTGFELYTVTDNKCGTAVVTVTGDNLENPEMLIYNTYFGYSYNSATNEWVANTTTSDEATLGVYQVPVISLTGLTYDTYTVTVQPRYAPKIDKIDPCRFYIDALRVYDPIDPAAIQAGTDIYDAYTANQEYDAHYESLREILIDAETFNAGGALTSGVADGIAFISTDGYQPHIENQKIPAELQTYIELGPKNEVCLGPGKGIAFDLTTLGGAIPAKLCIGVRAAQGSGTVTVNGTPLTVDCPTELYRNITNAVWTPNNDGTYTTHDPIVIINTSGNAVISLTKLKWSFGEKEAAKSPAARSLKFSFSRSALDTLALTAQNEGEGTLDASAVTVTWDKDTFELGETATLTITAPATFMRAFVDGEEIAGYTELDNGMRQWTYQVTAEELGLFPADVTLEDANEYRTGALKAPQLTATEPTVELTESAIAWENDNIMLGEAALLTVTVPAKVVSVTVNGETVTLFDLNEDGSKVFTWTVTPETAGEHVFKVTAAEGHGYASDEILTPALTVNEPAPETTTEEPTTEPATEEPTGDDGAQQGNRWSFRSLLEAILNFFRKVLNLFKTKA